MGEEFSRKEFAMSKYIAFLLRIWPGDSPEQPAWRACLEDPHTRQILAFDSIDDLYTYLCALASPSENGDQLPSVDGDIGCPNQDLPIG